MFTAIRPFLDDATLQKAMMIWQERYANKPKDAYTQFLVDCCTTQALKRQRPALLKAIFKTLELPEKDLLADPLNAQTNQFDNLGTVSATPVEAHMVFVKFVDALLENLQGDLRLKVKAYFMKYVGAKIQLSTNQNFALKTWMGNSNATLDAHFDNAHKRAMINLIYTALCEHIGPVKADQFLGLAVKTVEPLAIAHQVDLHDYL